MIRIDRVQPLAGSRLKVTFEEGLTGIFAVEPELRGGVFLKLIDPTLFNAVTINPDFGNVEWPGGIDLCPDAMYRSMLGSKENKTTVPETVLRDKAGEV